jgi:hypothetical protein
MFFPSFPSINLSAIFCATAKASVCIAKAIGKDDVGAEMDSARKKGITIQSVATF